MTKTGSSIVLLLFFLSVPGWAAAPASPACKARVEKLIKTTARNMGLTSDFGLQITEKPVKNQLVEFASGAFIVPDGYISNSSALVTVRLTKTDCEIVKIAIAVRAP